MRRCLRGDGARDCLVELSQGGFVGKRKALTLTYLRLSRSDLEFKLALALSSRCSFLVITMLCALLHSLREFVLELVKVLALRLELTIDLELEKHDFMDALTQLGECVTVVIE